MMFREKYPILYDYLSFCTIDNGLDLEQIRGIVQRGVSSNPKLAGEIAAAFSDDSVRWKEILNDLNLGEIYETDSENLAYDYARQMLVI